ncbi:MAG TPA: response regulator [Ignavibacteriaceae bacterium]|nr:response regulator [Ignavibacteriaceae bacterium]
MKILLVEDEGLVALYLKRILIEHGFKEINVARNGEEAVRRVDEFEPDLLLMDIRLGKGINGIEAVKQINTKKSIPVIYITASTDQQTHREALNTKPLAIISKPIEPDELNEMIDNYFDVRGIN